MEDSWKAIKQPLTSTCEEILRLKKHYHKEWISVETLDRIQGRKSKKTSVNNERTRTERVKAQTKYTEANKQVRRSIKSDKQKYVEELATTTKRVATKGNVKQPYDTTKKLAEEYIEPDRTVDNKEGKSVTELQEQSNR
ncbi:unnamed protein product [Schistosoma guineensis]|nr:unnamed protein product [Schistosoma guineensis]